MKKYIRDSHEILGQCPVESDGFDDVLKHVFNRYTVKTFLKIGKTTALQSVGKKKFFE